MPRFTVHLLTPYITWEGVEADDEDDAIHKCGFPPELDVNDGPYEHVVWEEEDWEED